MEHPKPTPSHKKLEAFLGSWTGREKLEPAPWDLVGGEAQSKMTAESLFNGMYIALKYAHVKEDKTEFQGLGIYCYDIHKQHYSMYWFDSFGFDPHGAAIGNWAGNSLVLDRKDEFGFTRYVFTFEGEDQMQMEIQISEDGKEFKRWLSSTCKRTGR